MYSITNANADGLSPNLQKFSSDYKLSVWSCWPEKNLVQTDLFREIHFHVFKTNLFNELGCDVAAWKRHETTTWSCEWLRRTLQAQILCRHRLEFIEQTNADPALRTWSGTQSFYIFIRLNQQICAGCDVY